MHECEVCRQETAQVFGIYSPADKRMENMCFNCFTFLADNEIAEWETLLETGR